MKFFVHFSLFFLSSEFSNSDFKEQLIDSKWYGYGVVTRDVDGDGKLDLILADQKKFAGTEIAIGKADSVLAENLTEGTMSALFPRSG